MKRWQCAEQFVADRLQSLGWEILARNFRHIGYEIDIIAKRGDTVVAFEVKYRRRICAETYETLIPNRKLIALERGFVNFITLQNLTYETLRIDLVVITQIEKTGDYSVFHFPNIRRSMF